MQEFERYKDTYKTNIDRAVAFTGQSQDFFTRVKARYLVKLLRGLQEQNAERSVRRSPLTVLDVGCGLGDIHQYVTGSDIAIRLSGVDVAASLIDQARQSNPSVNYDVYAGDTLPYADNSFDAAYTIAVMHHVPPAQWVSFLEEMRRVVRPGGLIAIFEHNPFNPLTTLIVKTCAFDANAVLLTQPRLRRLLKTAGFQRIWRRYICFTPFDRPWFHKLDDKMGWLPLGAQYFVAARVPDRR